MKEYFYRQLSKYLSVYIFPEDSVLEINPLKQKAQGTFPKLFFAFNSFHNTNRFSNSKKTQKRFLYYT